jgi:hypothetical protein
VLIRGRSWVGASQFRRYMARGLLKHGAGCQRETPGELPRLTSHNQRPQANGYYHSRQKDQEQGSHARTSFPLSQPENVTLHKLYRKIAAARVKQLTFLYE